MGHFIVQCAQAVGQGGVFLGGIGQLRLHLLQVVVLALQDAQLDLGGLAARPGNVIEVFGLAGGQVGIAALQLQQAVAGYITFGGQYSGALQFLVEEADLRGAGAVHLLQAL
ncbi:hypothetical protein D3C76_340640 [compost metagenome]